MSWRFFNIRPHYDGRRYEVAQSFYAPDLEAAFALARAEWPTAIGWEVL